MKNKIFFFSFSYPYSHGFSWKRNELELLSKEFEVTVIPYLKAAEIPFSDFPSGIKLKSPIFSKPLTGNWADIYHTLTPKRIVFYWKEFFRAQIYKSSSHFYKWIISSKRTNKLLNAPIVKELLKRKTENADTILYFHWGLGISLIIPFLRKAGYKKIVVRFHGFDLYEDRNEDYIPFRSSLLKSLDLAIFISQHGLDYLKGEYPDIHFEAKLFRIGSKNSGQSWPGDNNTLNLVTCSSVIPLKRLDLLVNALKLISYSVNWTHLGDGELFEKLKQQSSLLPANITAKFPGRLKPVEVQKFYENNPVDLFINVSSTEGVPVSIMEAFSAGIPVMATGVGGTPEIVNARNGYILPCEINAEELAGCIVQFLQMGEPEKHQMRRSARETFENFCDHEKLTSEFISFLKSF